MMGSPNEFGMINGGMSSSLPGQYNRGQGQGQGQTNYKHQKATFSGLTALIGVLALIIDIVSIAVPHWGQYSPAGVAFYASGGRVQDNTGHFGPFQTCKYSSYYSYCGGSTIHQATVWLTIGGICAVVALVCLGLFSLFAILHVAMQLQRREIMVSYGKAVFLKVVLASIAALATLGAVIFGGVHFGVGGRHSALHLSMGIMYYIQIILVFVTLLLVILSYLSWRKAKKHPLPIVPKNTSVAYEVRNGNGVAMTASSGSPYMSSYRHGQPRFPNQVQQPNYIYNTQQQQQQQHFQPQQWGGPGQMGYVNDGFQPVSLSVPNLPQQTGAQPMQAIRPIQPVQGIPQSSSPSLSRAANNTQMPMGGVSFAPGGKTGTGGAGYSVQMSSGVQGGFGGSVESLNSTNSSSLSFGSTVSTGSGHHPLRSSLKKPKNRDMASISSESSSKRVRLSLGAEQTSV